MHNEYKHYALDLCPRKARYWSCRQIGTEERRAQKESGQEHEMDVNEFGQIGKQKGDMQCRLSVLRTQSRFRTWETAAYAPTRYTELDQQYIGGIWRCGKEGSRLIDTDPFTGEALAEIVQASGTDLDEAYESAAKAQVSWAARNPAERAAIMLRSSRIMEQRRDEIVDWLIKESGSTRLKAELEW